MHLPEPDSVHDAARAARAQALGALAELVDALNGPEGCPWDREQGPAAIARYLVEEGRELMDAVGGDEPGAVAEEWGDVAFLLLFFAVAAERDGLFALPDAVEAAIAKMIRRHPHVFAAAKVDGADEVLRRWKAIKARECAARDDDSVLGDLPPQVSALRRADAIQTAVARVGFDWPDITGVWEKVAEEIAELQAARAENDPEAVARELGDLQFALVNLQRHLGLAPEQPLNDAVNRFAARFRAVERLASERDIDLMAATLEQLDALWDEAKMRSPERSAGRD